MIIFGYPGVGKTTLSKDDYRFIDLDSSDPLVRWRWQRKDWETDYCNMALLLSKQGYYVMVSTHPEVVKRVMARTKDVGLIFPDKQLKKLWIARLYKRYQEYNTRPVHNAWLRAKEHFDEDIDAMAKLKCPKIVLTTMDYNLKRGILETFEGGAKV